ncbi:MAG: rod shape-determining protein MreC [Burkholderiales bacterium]
MDHQPPPFFNRGPSPLVRIVLFTLLSVWLMVLDAHQHYLLTLRQSLSVVIYPLQQLANSPQILMEQVSSFFVTQSALHKENDALKQQRLANALQLQHAQSLQAENTFLRKLLNARKHEAGKTVMAEIFYTGRDPFSRKIFLDKGSAQQINAGQAVMDNVGIVGQVTRVYPFSSEVTLITDKDQAVPVAVLRNGTRAVVFGNGQDGTLDLPFMPVNTDIVNGDVLVTSGIDGTYPAGLPVAVVSKIERNAAYAFAKITCSPSAGVDRHKQLLVVSVPPQPALPPPVAADTLPAKKTPGGQH